MIGSHELIVDSFAGGGGASEAIRMALGRDPDIAINHDAKALSMHRANHPGSTHYCENVWKVDPVKVCAGRPVGLFWASPDCTHHSRAKGGKPRDNALRGLAWVVVRWAEKVRPRVIFLENVPEFAEWGPVVDGTPNPMRKGFHFRRWCGRLRNLGYELDMREMAACDYGAPTTRKRLFLIARCDGEPIVWPDRTHGRGLLPYRTAAECIDWSDLGSSIFTPGRDLADNTMRRVARGIVRHVINDADPFIVTMRGTQASHIDASARSAQEPLRTVNAKGQHHAVVTPQVIAIDNGSSKTGGAWAGRAPLRTIVTENRFAAVNTLLAPFLLNTRNGERKATATTRGQEPRVRSVQDPSPTITAVGSQGAIVSACLAKHYGGHENDGTPMGRCVDAVTAKDHHSLVAALLLKYYGTDQNPKLREPLATVRTKDCFALVTVHGQPHYIADIYMRMLKPRELFTAQGFPAGYRIDQGLNEAGELVRLTQTDQIRMCGNSVSPPPAYALIEANYGRREVRRFADGRLF